MARKRDLGIGARVRIARMPRREDRAYYGGALGTVVRVYEGMPMPVCVRLDRDGARWCFAPGMLALVRRAGAGDGLGRDLPLEGKA